MLQEHVSWEDRGGLSCSQSGYTRAKLAESLQIACQTDQKLPFKKRLAKWEKTFNDSTSLFSPAEIDRTKEKIGFWRWMLGFASEAKVTSRWKFALSIIIGLFSVLGAIGLIKPEFVRPLMELLKSWLQ